MQSQLALGGAAPAGRLEGGGRQQRARAPADGASYPRLTAACDRSTSCYYNNKKPAVGLSDGLRECALSPDGRVCRGQRLCRMEFVSLATCPWPPARASQELRVCTECLLAERLLAAPAPHALSLWPPFLECRGSAAGKTI
jgi:hypothetical protein